MSRATLKIWANFIACEAVWFAIVYSGGPLAYFSASRLSGTIVFARMSQQRFKSFYQEAVHEHLEYSVFSPLRRGAVA